MWFRDYNNKVIEILRENFISDKDYYEAICKANTNKIFPKINNEIEKILQIVNNNF